MAGNFREKLIASIEKRDSLLCIGLDPQMDIAFEDDVVSTIYNYNRNIIEQTVDYTACYKPNIAFYEQVGPEGIAALRQTLELIPEDIPVILDAKRGDIGNTAQAYAKSIFGDFNVDATTVSGYMGRESVEPFLEYDGRGIFVLCRTSNPGAAAFQELQVLGGPSGIEPLFMNVAREAASWSEDVGLVVAGNDIAALKAIRSILPSVWILAPGIGTQGGKADEAINAGIGKDGHNIVINVSRAVADDILPGRKAKELRDQINKARKNNSYFMKDQGSGMDLRKKELIKEIIEVGCFKIGSFTLKSGLISPFYIDLRKLISNPGLLNRAAAAYCSLIRDLKFDRVAGIPFAAISVATCIALQLDVPMVFPRLQKKEHGTGSVVEGNYEAGETVILVDDLITTGKSKIEALDVLKEAGLKVTDLVVLIERGAQGRKDMEAAGINLHSYLSIEDFIEVCIEMNMVDEDKLKEIKEFLAQG